MEPSWHVLGPEPARLGPEPGHLAGRHQGGPIQIMTVLVAASSPVGFAIAADGRRVSTNGEYWSDSAQKIWSAVYPRKFAIAYGWCGNTRLETRVNAFDFPSVSQEVFDDVNDTVDDAKPEALFKNFVQGVHLRLKSFLEGVDSSLSNVTLPEVIAQVLLVGYVGQNPVQFIATFAHQKGQVQVPCLRSYDAAEDDLLLLSGSATLFSKLVGPENASLEIATETVRRYTQDCVDHQCTIEDCSSFGGHVHVANVTKDGFHWVIPPIETK